MNKDNQSIDLIYAEKWKTSSKLFEEKGYYKWMSSRVKAYNRILEIGCGSGNSTLALANDGHEVLVVEKNHECTLMAQKLLQDSGYGDKVSFLEGDIILPEFRNSVIKNNDVDVVICWNPGTQLDTDSLTYYTKYMIEYGLTAEQIKRNPSPSYCELILWHACDIAKSMNKPIHIIDRTTDIDEELVNYYNLLGNKTGYSYVQFDLLEAETISDGGVQLVSNGVLQNNYKMPIVLLSILFLKEK